MKISHSKHSKAFTLIELTVVMSVIMLLIGLSIIGIKAYQNWQKALSAGEEVKKVRTAQQMYLSDHITQSPSEITEQNIIDYLPNGGDAIPTAVGIDGEELTIDYTVSPPVLKNGETVYDPSGNPQDGQWDSGK